MVLTSRLGYPYSRSTLRPPPVVPSSLCLYKSFYRGKKVESLTKSLIPFYEGRGTYCHLAFRSCLQRHNFTITLQSDIKLTNSLSITLERSLLPPTTIVLLYILLRIYLRNIPSQPPITLGSNSPYPPIPSPTLTHSHPSFPSLLSDENLRHPTPRRTHFPDLTSDYPFVSFWPRHGLPL